MKMKSQKEKKKKFAKFVRTRRESVRFQTKQNFTTFMSGLLHVILGVLNVDGDMKRLQICMFDSDFYL